MGDGGDGGVITMLMLVALNGGLNTPLLKTFKS